MDFLQIHPKVGGIAVKSGTKPGVLTSSQNVKYFLKTKHILLLFNVFLCRFILILTLLLLR